MSSKHRQCQRMFWLKPFGSSIFSSMCFFMAILPGCKWLYWKNIVTVMVWGHLIKDIVRVEYLDLACACAYCMRGLMWSKEFFYLRCHEREFMAVLYGLTAETHGRNCRTETSDSSLLHVEFPPSWLKYCISILLPYSLPQEHSFNNLQNGGGRWEAIKVTYICLIS